MVSDKLKKIISDELGLDNFEFMDETTADQVPGWDSFNHITGKEYRRASELNRFKDQRLMRGNHSIFYARRRRYCQIQSPVSD